MDAIGNTNRDIEQGNKLIAEFMGAIFKEHPMFKQMCYFYEMSNTPTDTSSSWWNADQMRYHSSWEWIMPVVEKIEKQLLPISYKIGNKLGCMAGDAPYYCQIRIVREVNPINDITYGETQLEAVYKSVIQFIQWFNTNSKEGSKL